MDIELLQGWVGRTQTTRDVASAGPLAGLAALLDHASPPWPAGQLPPLAHWLYFLPRDRQSMLDTDGHPKRGDFLPPVELPRRMWVGSRVRQLASIPLDAIIERRSTIAHVTAKSGRAGPMVFVTVKHEVMEGGAVAIIEEQYLVYRGAPLADGGGSGAASAAVPRSAEPRTSAASRRFVPDPVKLFRFSSLTCNAHRIHYDRDYARNVEGYPGLVVHGPLVATLLMDHYLQYQCAAVGGGSDAPARRPETPRLSFTFRAERPLFDTAPFELCVSDSSGAGADLWALDPTGAVAVTAAVERL